MKKKLVLVVFLVGAIFLFKNDFISLAQDCFDNQTHPKFQKRETFFAGLSMEFYGTPEYAEQLDLVNRALKLKKDSSIMFDDLIIPSKDAISRLKRRQTVTSFQNIAQRQPIYFEQITDEFSKLDKE